jgi:hypothetical protein
MGTNLNQWAFANLINEDIKWLLLQPRTLEREHIIFVLEHASKTYNCRQTPVQPDESTKPMYDREGNYLGEWNGKVVTGAKYQIGSQPNELPEDAPIEPKALEMPLEQLMEWYNSPNAVTYQRYTYFDALCRHVLWLEIKRTSVPKRESSSEWQPIENFDESQERKHW